VVALGRGNICNKWCKSQQHLGGHRFYNNEDVEMAVGERLQMQEPDFYCDGIFKLVLKWDKCINVLRDYVKK
jgi:hypothetical protein